MEKPTEERRRKMQADRKVCPHPLAWIGIAQKEMKAVRLQGSISLNRENYRNTGRQMIEKGDIYESKN